MAVFSAKYNSSADSLELYNLYFVARPPEDTNKNQAQKGGKEERKGPPGTKVA